jgi:phosphoglycolate phosphatase
MQLVLFDLDGTLIDSEVGITTSMAHALREVGAEVPAPEVLRRWIGPPLRTSFPSVLGDDEGLVDLAVTHYLERFRQTGWREHSVYPGIAELVAGLAQRGARLAVVTSKIIEQARRIVDHLPFGHHFDAVYGPGPETRTSEKAALVATAVSDLGAHAGRITMIGDRRFDIEGARANAVRSIGVLWGFGTREELQAAGADSIVGSVAALSAQLHGDAGAA